MKMTPRRLEAAKTVLENYREELFSRHSFDCFRFEIELRAALRTGYHGIKDVMCQMVERKHRPPFEKPTDRYRQVAAYYMEHENGGMIVCEYQLPLTELFGAADYASDDWREKEAAYWERTFAWGGIGDRPPEESLEYRIAHALG